MAAVVVLTDHGSGEGSRAVLEAAVRTVTGTTPTSIDARHVMTGGQGRATVSGTRLELQAPGGPVLIPDVVLIYEIPPADRHRIREFQAVVRRSETSCLGDDAQSWHAATDKHRTIERFRRDGIAHMPTRPLHRPDHRSARAAFDELGGDVWTRPRTGLGGEDVFHVTTPEQLDTVRRHYAATDQDWLVSRDAGNIDRHGRRHQFRVVVLHERVLRVVEHVQADPDAPCNEARGAVSTAVAVDDLPSGLGRLAIAATRSVGLPFGGVDLVAESGGVVFEVNVHPVLDVPGGLETVAIPYVRAHRPPGRRDGEPVGRHSRGS